VARSPSNSNTTLSKPCRMLWFKAEMPRGFVFQLPVDTTVYTKNAKLDAGNEAGFNSDIIFEDYLIAQYERTTTQDDAIGSAQRHLLVVTEQKKE
jgi:hypothetical protein